MVGSIVYSPLGARDVLVHLGSVHVRLKDRSHGPFGHEGMGLRLPSRWQRRRQPLLFGPAVPVLRGGHAVGDGLRHS